MSTTLATVDPNQTQAWGQWVSRQLDTWVGWVQGNAAAAARDYEAFKADMRDLRAQLCRLDALYQAAPPGRDRETLRANLCHLVGRYARYAHVVWGSTAVAKRELFATEPPTCEFELSQDGTRLQSCVGLEPASAIAVGVSVSVVAMAVAIITWVRTDLSRVREMIAAYERGVPPEVLEQTTGASSFGGLGAGLLAILGLGVAAVVLLPMVQRR